MARQTTLLTRTYRLGTVISVALLVTLDIFVAQEQPDPKNSLRFSEHLIAGGYGYAYGVAAADLDGDGDLDLTSQDILGKPARSFLYWFENDGQGSFSRHTIHQNEPGWFERHAVGDLTGDGKRDIVIANNREGHLVWFANNDRPAKGPWKRHVLTTKCPQAYDVVLADIDGDGDLDAAASGWKSDLLTWYENPGKRGWDKEWVQRKIDDTMKEARTIRSGDFNGDGKVDLLGSAVGVENKPREVDVKEHKSSVVWYENPGQPKSKSWKKHVIDDTSRGATHGHPTDLDDDGDLDVVMALGMAREHGPEDKHEIAWYEHTRDSAKKIRWKKHKIGALPCAFEAFASDLDGDGDTDVVATAWATGDRVVWFENHGDPRGKWSLHVLRESWHAANQVIVADLNGDNRPDIAATADDGSRRVQGALELRWWRNEGTK